MTFFSCRRLQSIWSHLVATGLADQCVKVAREATLEEIRSVHSEAHTIQYGVTTPLHCTSSKFQVLPCGGQGVDSDTYWNENYTSQAAKIAAGTVLELSTLVSKIEKSITTLVFQIIVQVVIKVQVDKILKIDRSAGWNKAMQVGI